MGAIRPGSHERLGGRDGVTDCYASDCSASRSGGFPLGRARGAASQQPLGLSHTPHHRGDEARHGPPGPLGKPVTGRQSIARAPGRQGGPFDQHVFVSPDRLPLVAVDPGELRGSPGEEKRSDGSC